MNNKDQHIIYVDREARLALKALDELSDTTSKTLFVVDNDDKLVGSITDGDIRRGLLHGLEISHPIKEFMNTDFKYLKDSTNNIDLISEYKKAHIYVVPLLNDEFQIVNILDLKKTKTLLPVCALIMAGGRGERLKPFTDMHPKPMLKVGGIPILEHNINRLISYGIKEIYISVKYLKEQIIEYFGNGSDREVKIHYIEEVEALGTLGALSLIDKIQYEDILVMNSDILTNIDFEDFYNYYKQHNANMMLASIPYKVNIPYAVLEIKEHQVSAFKEKPSYIYYSNGGIYLMRFDMKNSVKSGTIFNATDLMEIVIADNEQKLMHYPLLGYWLDIGNHQDYLKAQEDVKHVQF